MVENKVGANGIIGMEACAKAPPDGYTLCIPSFSQVTMNPVLYAKLPYEPLKDLAPVINIGVINSAVVVNASVPANTLRELMELGKAKPGQLNWGSWGLGSFPHLYATVLQNASGASFTHVPYKSIDQVVTSLLAGDVQVMSAGTGVRHAEYNLEAETTRIFQIWIEPTERGGAPSWGARPFPKEDRAGRFVPLASGLPGDGDALPIRTNARVLGATLKAGDQITYDLDPSRHAYLVPAVGSVEVNGVSLATRDRAAITGETAITIRALEDAELVMVDAA